VGQRCSCRHGHKGRKREKVDATCPPGRRLAALGKKGKKKGEKKGAGGDHVLVRGRWADPRTPPELAGFGGGKKGGKRGGAPAWGFPAGSRHSGLLLFQALRPRRRGEGGGGALLGEPLFWGLPLHPAAAVGGRGGKKEKGRGEDGAFTGAPRNADPVASRISRRKGEGGERGDTAWALGDENTPPARPPSGPMVRRKKERGGGEGGR